VSGFCECGSVTLGLIRFPGFGGGGGCIVMAERHLLWQDRLLHER
jgi:hypothetical protein